MLGGPCLLREHRQVARLRGKGPRGASWERRPLLRELDPHTTWNLGAPPAAAPSEVDEGAWVHHTDVLTSGMAVPVGQKQGCECLVFL